MIKLHWIILGVGLCLSAGILWGRAIERKNFEKAADKFFKELKNA